MKRLACVLLLSGCYDWDALSSTFDFSGAYTVVVTNGQNGCGFGSWTVGAMSDAIPLNVTQSGDQVVVTVMGLPGTALNIFCGTNQLVGSVKQGAMDASIICPKMSTQMTCLFHYVAHAQATLNGNHITGHIDYTTNITTMTADCAQLPDCLSSQSFVGNR
jgi:hypothetical protein